MNSWSLSTRTDASDTRTIQTTAMTVSSGKRVSENFHIERDQTRGHLTECANHHPPPSYLHFALFNVDRYKITSIRSVDQPASRQGAKEDCREQ